MKIPSKEELQQLPFNHSSDIDFTKPYYFLLIDATLTSDNPLLFRKNLLERI